MAHFYLSLFPYSRITKSQVIFRISSLFFFLLRKFSLKFHCSPQPPPRETESTFPILENSSTSKFVLHSLAHFAGAVGPAVSKKWASHRLHPHGGNSRKTRCFENGNGQIRSSNKTAAGLAGRPFKHATKVNKPIFNQWKAIHNLWCFPHQNESQHFINLWGMFLPIVHETFFAKFVNGDCKFWWRARSIW